MAWFSRDDPLPFLVMCLRLMLRMVERVLRIRPTANIANRMPAYVRGLRSRFTRKAGAAV